MVQGRIADFRTWLWATYAAGVILARTWLRAELNGWRAVYGWIRFGAALVWAARTSHGS
jgi:hypothetical protein